MKRFNFSQQAALSVVCASLFAQTAGAQEAETQIEEVIVVGQSQVFANNLVNDSMKRQQSTITSVNAVIDNLPGVSVNEGDTYGFDDWSTNITVRGFTVSLDEQQVGTTIDGFPNGNSNYGGGAKANRYIDSGNLGGVEVSQGTADIASRSHEALGGTINYLTDGPLESSRLRTELAFGEFDAQRFSVRYDTGAFGNDSRAWISFSQQEATDWVNGSAENTRDHFAAKLVSGFESLTLTGYLSYDDTHEDNYQRLYSRAEFDANSEWDRLTDNWSGIPYVDQVFREGWSTLRENTFAYLKADAELNDAFKLSGGLYHHDNEGRGDWVPPYLVDVTADSGAESEFAGGGTVEGGAALGRIYFVDGQGNALSPMTGCVSSITFPYGGAGFEYDPACYPNGAIAVQSYRHTHYEKDRTGATADFTWSMDFDAVSNELRGGLWYEDATRDEWRDWHKISDTRIGPDFDGQPYWVQYSRSYPQETTKWYLQDSVSLSGFTVALGLQQFLVDVERKDLFGDSSSVSIDSDSDTLLSGGLVWNTPIEGLEVFLGYAENFKAISDLILERPDSDLSSIEPETSENRELGIRYRSDRLSITATYYENDFENRLIFLSAETETGPNYLIGTNGTYFNAGGIESSGLELAVNYQLLNSFNIYLSYTDNDSTYIGTGDPLVDSAVGITPGNKVLGIADNQYVAGLDWSGEIAYAGISYKYTGERYANLNNSWLVDDYALTDLYIGTSALGISESLDGMNINFVVNNLFDEDYLGTVVNGGAWIGAPRTYSLSVSIDF